MYTHKRFFLKILPIQDISLIKIKKLQHNLKKIRYKKTIKHGLLKV